VTVPVVTALFFTTVMTAGGVAIGLSIAEYTSKDRKKKNKQK